MEGLYMTLIKKIKGQLLVNMLLLVLCVVFGATNAEAKDSAIYEDGIYRYQITNDIKKEVTLIGFEIDDSTEELIIPGKTIIANKEYTITQFSLQYSYFNNKYNGVKKIIVSEDFEGDFIIWSSFYNVKSYEFKGNIPPKTIKIHYFHSGDWKDLNVAFKVPAGKEEDYRKNIKFILENSGNEYEYQIEATIVTSDKEDIEYLFFQADGLLCQVIKSGATGSGEVKLVQSYKSDYGYYKLQDTVKYNGYDYKITKLGSFSLGARNQVISIPDTVKELESEVFNQYPEIIFLSKNIKEIPANIISVYDEDDYSYLKFIYVPEGVTTIKDKAFEIFMMNKASIILPKSITSLGKNSLYGFKLVTFLNDKPIVNITSAIENCTTVKVSKNGLNQYRKLLSNNILMEEAKNVVKSTSLSVNKKNININTATSYTLVGTLSEGSNETVFWNSSNNDIFDISSKGVVNPKRAGTAYAVAYTRTSGLHQVVKVTVTEALKGSRVLTLVREDRVGRTTGTSVVIPKA